MRRTLLLGLALVRTFLVVVILLVAREELRLPDTPAGTVEVAAREATSVNLADPEPSAVPAHVDATSTRTAVPVPDAHTQSAAHDLDIFGRAVDESGEPLPYGALCTCRLQNLPVNISADDASMILSEPIPISLGEDGRFRVTRKTSARPGLRPVLAVRWEEQLDGLHPSPSKRSGFVEIESQAGSSVNVGDVVMKLDPLLAGGVVVDSSGAPVAGASVWVGARSGSQDWASLAPERAHSDAYGRFRVLGRTATATVTVVVTGAGCPTQRIEGVLTGTPDLRIVSDRSQFGWVDLRIETDAGFAPDLVDVCLASRGFSLVARPSSAGVVHFANVEPGTCRLSVRAQGTRFVVQQLDGLEVPVGAGASDVRLEPLDLRGKLAWLRATIRSSNGSLFAREHVDVQGGVFVDRRIPTDAEGRIELLVPARVPTWTLHVQGYADCEIADGATIRLVGQ